MNIKEWNEQKIKKMKWYSPDQAKTSTIFFTLFVITAWPAALEFVLKFDWYWYLIISLVVGAPLLKTAFNKSN